ncbi:MAG: endonuclease III [Desulfuromonadales bacterium]
MTILDILECHYPDAQIALNFSNHLELLIATILSAQCTDVQVNKVTPALFRKYPDVRAYAQADCAELAEDIRAIGFFRNKAKNIVAAADAILRKHGGNVPRTMEELVALAGVGRKTANVVLGNAFGIPGMVVDTHVRRVSRRLGWTSKTDPEKIEAELGQLLPRERWNQTSHLLIWHGRKICRAPTPHCSICPVRMYCPQINVEKFR